LFNGAGRPQYPFSKPLSHLGKPGGIRSYGNKLKKYSPVKFREKPFTTSQQNQVYSQNELIYKAFFYE
jgi:hypothetical protein